MKREKSVLWKKKLTGAKTVVFPFSAFTNLWGEKKKLPNHLTLTHLACLKKKEIYAVKDHLKSWQVLSLFNSPYPKLRAVTTRATVCSIVLLTSWETKNGKRKNTKHTSVSGLRANIDPFSTFLSSLKTHVSALWKKKTRKDLGLTNRFAS